MIVQAIDTEPSGASISSTIRDCCGQSMWLAVVTCQKPMPRPRRQTGVTVWRWVWPFTQSTTQGWRAAGLAARRRGPGGGRPGARSLTMVSSGWWLNSTTSRSCAPRSWNSSQASCVSSSEPCQPPCGLTVSMHDDAYPVADVERVVAAVGARLSGLIAMAGRPAAAVQMRLAGARSVTRSRAAGSAVTVMRPAAGELGESATSPSSRRCRTSRALRASAGARSA